MPHQPLTDPGNEERGKERISPSDVRFIEVTQKDLDTELPVQKGIYAVLPAYNEELVIGSVVLRARQYVEHVIVVDDGSTDHTAEVAKLAGADVIHLEYNTGKAYTILLGLKHARDNGCSVAVMLDADGQHDPREILRVAQYVSAGKADLVIGSRFLEKNSEIPFYRQIGQKILDLSTNLSSKSNVTDSQSGFRALSGKALDNLDFNTHGYNIESDMIAHFSSLGFSIMEVPISVKYDVPNKHKKHPVTHGMGVFSRVVNLIAYKRPLLLFGIFGAVCFLIGIFASYLAFNEYAATSRFPFGISMVSMVFIIMGMLLVITGLLLNTLMIIMRDHHKI